MAIISSDRKAACLVDVHMVSCVDNLCKESFRCFSDCFVGL